MPPNMALFCKPQILVPYFDSKKYGAIQTPFSPKPAALMLNTPKGLNPSLQICLCSGSSSSFTHPHASDSPTSIIFVKGLPLSTSEGRLKIAFASYGDVSRVKILMDKITREPLGLAYIWFSSPGSAQTAVKEMNGEFFDGRFISVTTARPGSCMPRPKPTPLKF